MILHYERLQRYPVVFKALTGLRGPQFDELVADVLPRYQAAERARLNRPTRQRALGAGHPFELDPRNQILLTVIWLRVYPIYEVLAYLFGVSATTVGRVIARVLPVLAASRHATMRMPDPGRKRRRTLDALLADTPELAVVIDTFEQPVQRPKDRTEADRYYSGKKSATRSKVRSRSMRRRVRSWMWRGAFQALPPTSPCWRSPPCWSGCRWVSVASGTWRMSGSLRCIHTAWERHHGANRGARTAQRRTSAITGPLRGDGSWWNIVLDGGGGINR